MITNTQELHILEAWNEKYHKMLSAQIKRGMENRVKHGDWPAMAPLGYRNVKQNGKPHVALDPLVAPLVQQAFYFAAEGKHPLRKILSILTERGLLSRRGDPLTISALCKMLTNPFYMGQMRVKGCLHKGRYEPLIDEHMFAQVQRKLAKRQKN